MASVSVGQDAPDFTLRDENNQNVTLSSLKGTKVVLMFYPFDFSGFCTAEMCAVRDDYSAFEKKGAKVFGISRDSMFTHKAFKEKEGFTHSLLADMKGDVARLYGAWNEAVGAADRVTVIIDEDGKVSYVQHNGMGEMRNMQDAVDALG